MPDRNTSLPLLVLLVALLFVSNSPSTSPEPARGREGDELARLLKRLEGQIPQETRPLAPDVRVLAHYFGLTALGQRTTAGDEERSLEHEVDRRLAEPGVALRVVIASVPDPVDTRLAHYFDQYLDALQQAASDLDYTLNGFSWAWLGDPERAKGSDQHRREPGALLFRRGREPGEPDHLLLLLLVGESPTSGVHWQAMEQALEIGFARNPDDEPLGFVGPTFSASAPQLRRLLSSWQPGAGHRAKRTIAFHSGSATAEEVGRLLEGDLGLGLSSRFHPLTHDDGLRLQAFRAFVDERHEREASVALLVEGGTTYGEQATSLAKSSQATRDEQSECEPQASKPAESDRTPPPLVVRFPLHVAELRAVAESDDAKKKSSDPLDTPFARDAVDLALREHARASDIPQPFARSLAANVAELELSASLGSLRQRRVAWAGVVATDKRDEVLIAQILERVASEIHLFTLDSDVLYAHPQFSQDLLGTVFVSSYPLTVALNPRLQSWTGVPNRAAPGGQSFGNGGAEGTYRAALLAYEGPSACEGSNKEELPCRWIADPTGKKWKRPPVWISAVGRDGPWPIWTWTETGLEEAPILEPNGQPIEFPLVRPAVLYRVVLVVIALAAGYLGALALAMRFAPLQRRWKSWLGEPESVGGVGWLFAKGGSCRAAAGAVFLAICSALIAWASGLALLPMVVEPSAWRSHVTEFLPDLLLPVFVVSFLLLPALFDSLARVLAPEAAPTSRHWACCFLLSLGVSAASLTLLLCFAQGDGVVNGLLLSFRSVNPGSGLSLVVPVALLQCGFLLMLAVLARRGQLDEKLATVRVEKLGSLEPYSEMLARELAPRLSPRRVTPAAALAYALLLVVPGVVFACTAWLPLDGDVAELVFVVSTLMFLSALAHSGIGFMTIWMRMRRFLNALAAHPLRDAFGRLPLRMSRPIGLEPYATPPEVAELSHPVELAQILARMKRAECTKAAQSPDDEQLRRDCELLRHVDLTGADDLAASLEIDLRRAAAARRSLAVPDTETQRRLRDLAPILLRGLELWWSQRGSNWREKSGDLDESKLVDASAGRPFDGVTVVNRGLAPAGSAVWCRLAEELVAGQIVAYLSHVFVHLRAALRGTMVGLVILLLALTSYPFEPQVPSLNFVVTLIAVAVVAGIAAFVQASRNEILSLIENTPPNRVTWNANLVTQLVTYVALPLLAALAAQLPILGRMASTVFDAFTTG